MRVVRRQWDSSDGGEFELTRDEDNAVTDAGCAALVEAMRSGALPLLDRLHLKGNPASEQALRGPAHELAALVATRLTARMRVTVSGPQQ